MVTDVGRSGANCMMGLAKGSSVAFAAGWMVSCSSTLSVDVKQQRTLNPAQTKRLNVTLIWRLNRIFLKFVDLKDFESFCGEGGIFCFWGREEGEIPRDV